MLERCIVKLHEAVVYCKLSANFLSVGMMIVDPKETLSLTFSFERLRLWLGRAQLFGKRYLRGAWTPRGLVEHG